MATDSVIAEVGQTLVGMLNDRMGGLLTDEEIVLGSPGEEGAGEDFRLTVYLYDVTQNEHLSNERARAESVGQPAGTTLVLDLHYLLTAHPKEKAASDTRTSRTVQQHRVLGRAMRIMAENSIIRRPDLHEDLPIEETLAITMDSISRGELIDIWGTFSDLPYRPSVSYVVSPVIVDARQPDTDQRVLEGTVNAFTYTSSNDGNERGDR